LNILCFEDNPQHQTMLQKIFAQYDVEFLFFSDPASNWSITNSEVLRQIVTFGPSLAIVDLMNDADGDTNAGYRVIRQLKETPETQSLPIVAWSVLICDSPDGQRTVEHVERFGAVPLQKLTDVVTPPSRFLEAAGFDPSTYVSRS
jgi:CheY-like chemotaxis protein